ncbi:Pyruvate dehydrogenase complex repressor [Dermatophilus congolensis]|uniref:Pyruvate dehydrogenase complex repressor n=1 Tax=Dermatophilus congolensis TaxID=1863 RepID=A0AA46BLW2_9MICO|nr:FadR/GntR family transcriptional regulator [Dermatophilus congolensis]STD05695.1 Pyruvate dehydrogenase complex repressor [Dermatophilus congolensis]
MAHKAQDGAADTPGPSWHPVTKKKAYEQVIAQVEEQIVARRLRVGDRLPAERELATMLGVSRAGVREAMRTLEAQGVVSADVGTDGGTFVTTMSSEAITRILRLHVHLSHFSVPEVLEARIPLERRSARLAASQASKEDLAKMREVLDEMADPSTPRDRFNELDTQFHVLVAAAGHNRLVTELTTAIRETMTGPIMHSFDDEEDWHARSASLCAGHEAIFTAIEKGDALQAAEAVESHIRLAYEQLHYHSN